MTKEPRDYLTVGISVIMLLEHGSVPLRFEPEGGALGLVGGSISDTLGGLTRLCDMGTRIFRREGDQEHRMTVQQYEPLSSRDQ